MKNIWIVGIAVLVLVGGYFYFSGNAVEVENNATYATFSDPSVELQFEYKSEPDGYVVDDLTAFIGEQQEGTEVLKVFRVMNAREKAELEASEGGREGPPVITVMIFKNLRNQSASQWADAFPLFSGMELVLGAVDRDAVVGGANAIRYRTDGLYQNENVVVAHGGYMYYFNGSFLEENSTIHKDFFALVDSVTFIPHVQENAKINVRVACESALAYMTFESGDAADAFVERCVNGEHPEVIDRYINNLGLDGASI